MITGTHAKSASPAVARSLAQGHLGQATCDNRQGLDGKLVEDGAVLAAVFNLTHAPGEMSAGWADWDSRPQESYNRLHDPGRWQFIYDAPAAGSGDGYREQTNGPMDS